MNVKVRQSRSRRSSFQAGSSAYEFTLLLPILCLLLFGLAEFGLGLYDKAVLADASREAAREAVTRSMPRITPSQITSVARNYAADHLITFGLPSSVAVEVDQSAGTGSGVPLRVTVSYDYKGFALARVVDALGGSVVLSAATTMNYQ
jgi:Flp pilus assembly protein TadG